jgi:integrase
VKNKARGLGTVYRPAYRDKATGVMKTAAVWWLCYHHRCKLHRESSGTTDRAEALRLLKRRHFEIAATGKVIGPAIEKTTLPEIMQMVVDDYLANGQKERVIRAPIAHLLAYFGPQSLVVDITSDRVTAYVAERLKAGASNATINRSLAALKRAMHLGMIAGKVAIRPEISLLKERNARKGFFEREEFETLLAELPECLKPVIATAYITGWRIASELLTRQKHHVDLNARWLRLDPNETKNAEGRMFPLTAELREILEAQLEHTRALEVANGQIIPGLFHHDGQPIRVFRRAWASACKRAGLAGRVPHDFRRTAVRNLERSGVPRSAAMKMTGHLTEAVYRRYAIVDEAMLREAGSRLSELHRADTGRKPRKVLPIVTG